jgi:hypothetical protein
LKNEIKIFRLFLFFDFTPSQKGGKQAGGFDG